MTLESKIWEKDASHKIEEVSCVKPTTPFPVNKPFLVIFSLFLLYECEKASST